MKSLEKKSNQPKKKGKRVYNYHTCLFCKRLVQHIQIHVKAKHAKEIKNLSKNYVRVHGDHKHNLKVVSDGKGEMLLSQRPVKSFIVIEYGPSEYCFEWMLKNTIGRHQSKCKDTEKKKQSVILESKILSGQLYVAQISKLMLKEVFPTMTTDVTSKIAQKDRIILGLGKSWLHHSYDNTCILKRKNTTSRRMCLCSRYLQILRSHRDSIIINNIEKQSVKPDAQTSEMDQETPIWEFLKPEYFEQLASAALEVAMSLVDDEEELKSPSNAIKLKYDLVRMVNIKWAYLFKNAGFNEEKKMFKIILQLVKVEWSKKVTKIARSVLTTRKLTQEREILAPVHIQKINEYIIYQLEKTELQAFAYTYRTVATLTETRLLMYNKRGSGEIDSIRKSQEERELSETLVAAEPQQAMPVQETMECIGDNDDNSSNIILDTQADMDIEEEEELVENFVESFGPPLYVLPPSQQVYNAPITQYHHYMTMCAFATYHSLSDRGFRHLIQLMGLHIPTENLMETNIDTLKQVCGFDTDCLIRHLYCPACKKLFTGDIENCKTPGCLGKKEKKTANYFVTGSMQAQLKEILERGGIWTAGQDYVSNRSSDHTTISDILDGEEYRKLKEPGGFLADKNNITFSLFTDGIPLFQSSKVSVWPVYLILNELPSKQRFTRKNMVLWGIWQGCGKPQMNMYQRPLAEDLIQLFQRGIEVNIKKTVIKTRAMMIVATMDLQARAYVLQMTQHNGEHGCLYCLEPGKVVKSGKGNCRSYPYRDVDPEPRTKENIRADAQEAIASGKRIHGINSESVLSCLPYFNVTTNVVIDYMHGILLGILKKLMSLWFDAMNSKEPYYIGKRVDAVDKIIKNIQPPYFLRRLPRKIAGNCNHWKASEFRSWLLYFSLPALQNILPDIYLTHYSLLVEGTFILPGGGISEADLRRADLLLRRRNLNMLYRESIVGLNAHNLIHLTRCVRMWGPLWAWSCFVFESFDGEIKKSIHGTGNACRQIFWSLQCQKKVEAMAVQCQEDQLRDFYQCMTEGSNARQKGGEDASQCVVFTPAKIQKTFHFSNDVKEELVQLCGTCKASNWMMVKKISRNGFLIFSKQCTPVVKRNSYTIKMVNNSIVEVGHYLLHKSSRKVGAVCQKFQPLGPLIRNRLQHLQTFQLQSVENTVVRAELLQEPVDVVKTESKICCGVIPNNVERD